MWAQLFRRGLGHEDKTKLCNDQIEHDIQKARRERRLELDLLLLGKSFTFLDFLPRRRRSLPARVESKGLAYTA